MYSIEGVECARLYDVRRNDSIGKHVEGEHQAEPQYLLHHSQTKRGNYANLYLGTESPR